MSRAAAHATQAPFPAVRLLSDEECWARMPAAISGGGQRLPVWVRAVAETLPRTAAAMLQVDFAQRVRSPLDPVLRAKMRWVVARSNRCEYFQASALADLKRVDDGSVAALTGDPSRWPEADREPLEFARLLTVAAPSIPDALFERLRARFGNSQVAAMVLLAAYGNFQDRLVLGLALPPEPDGPLPPLAVRFPDDAFQAALIVPPQAGLPGLEDLGETVVDDDPEWSTVSYEALQSRLERQRDRTPRLPIPAWDNVRVKLPPAMAARPTRIVWNLVCYGYVPELAVPWSLCTRTMWSEAQGDRVFEESLFWVQTRAVGCNYCMGHCEMLLEVAGLDGTAVAERTRRLSSGDWSAFPPEAQRAYAYARKLSRTPWELTPGDYRTLVADLGPRRAMATFWWLCRGLYMTRISDGFQLPLERDNVFQPVDMPRPKVDAAEIERLSRLPVEEVERIYSGTSPPEAVKMLLAILRGSMMNAGEGWFGPAQSRYSWSWFAERFGIGSGESVSAEQFLERRRHAPRAVRGATVDTRSADGARSVPATFDERLQLWFQRLDRNRDGRITAEDLDWSERNSWVHHAYVVNRLFRRIDPDGDGQLTREDWLAFFERAAGGKDRLSSEEFRDALLSGISNSFLPGDAPTREVLLRGLISGDVGSIEEGPSVGDPAPDFTLKTLGERRPVRLADLIGPRPVVLVFGNYTCAPFRSMFPGVDEVARRFRDEASFLAVYVREAHPTDGWHMESNARAGVKAAQPASYDERSAVAGQCQALLKPSMVVLVDELDDRVGHAWSGMPSRLYVIDRAGQIAFKSGRGPFGFKAGEMEQALVMTLLEDKRA